MSGGEGALWWIQLLSKNSLRFAGKSDALAELGGRHALHTAEETGEIGKLVESETIGNFRYSLLVFHQQAFDFQHNLFQSL